MSQTYKGVTIPELTDASNSVVMAQGMVDSLRAPGQAAKVVDYVFTADDANNGTIIKADKATAIEFEIPPQADETFIANTILRWVNIGVGDLTIAPGAAVTFIGTELVFATGQGGMAIRNDTDEWVVVPFAIGGDVPWAVISSGGTVTTYSDGGIDYEVRDFTASGTLVVDEAGLVDVAGLGGGGGGGKYGSTYTHGGGGGAGGFFDTTQAGIGPIWMPAGSHAVTIGAGGSGNTDGCGSPSSIGSIVVIPGGGNGGGGYSQSGNGGSGSGAMPAYNGNANGKAVSGTSIGNDGGTSNSYAASGGGGGAGAVGGNGATTVGGNGGNGRSTSITGTPTTFGGGGGGGGDTVAGTGGTGGGGAGAVTGGNPVSGTANTGGGGGGCDTGTAANGGSGRIIVRRRTN